MISEITHLTPIMFGENAHKEVGRKMNELGAQRVLCVYDKGIKAAGVVDKILDTLKAADIEVKEFDEVVPDPPDVLVDKAGKLALELDVDSVLGIGGGSVLDTAKAVNVLLGNPGPIRQYFNPEVPQKPGRKLFLVPTTAGTGSEVTKVAVLSNTENGMKQGVGGPNCIANFAFVDPLLTVGLPGKLTASTGMDTFAHAAESYTSAMSNPMSDVLALEAISTVVKYLPLAVQNGSDIEARKKMSFACVTAGYAFGDTGVHLGHSLAHMFGAKYHVPHGMMCALTQPIVMNYVSAGMPEKVRAIGNAMGASVAGIPDSKIGEAVAEEIRVLNKKLGIPTMKELDFPEKELGEIAEGALADVCSFFMYQKLNKQEVLAYLKDEYNR